MPAVYEIRANYDRDTIVIYQAYSDNIADVALKIKRFASPFSFHRMTWIKPSFLWLMHRSNWGQKANQQRTLAVHISRAGWEKALSLGTLTHPEPSVFPNASVWRQNSQIHRSTFNGTPNEVFVMLALITSAFRLALVAK